MTDKKIDDDFDMADDWSSALDDWEKRAFSTNNFDEAAIRPSKAPSKVESVEPVRGASQAPLLTSEKPTQAPRPSFATRSAAKGSAPPASPLSVRESAAAVRIARAAQFDDEMTHIHHDMAELARASIPMASFEPEAQEVAALLETAHEAPLLSQRSIDSVFGEKPFAERADESEERIPSVRAGRRGSVPVPTAHDDETQEETVIPRRSIAAGPRVSVPAAYDPTESEEGAVLPRPSLARDLYRRMPSAPAAVPLAPFVEEQSPPSFFAEMDDERTQDWVRDSAGSLALPPLVAPKLEAPAVPAARRDAVSSVAESADALIVEELGSLSSSDGEHTIPLFASGREHLRRGPAESTSSERASAPAPLPSFATDIFGHGDGNAKPGAHPDRTEISLAPLAETQETESAPVGARRIARPRVQHALPARLPSAVVEETPNLESDDIDEAGLVDRAFWFQEQAAAETDQVRRAEWLACASELLAGVNDSQGARGLAEAASVALPFARTLARGYAAIDGDSEGLAAILEEESREGSTADARNHASLLLAEERARREALARGSVWIALARANDIRGRVYVASMALLGDADAAAAHSDAPLDAVHDAIATLVAAIGSSFDSESPLGSIAPGPLRALRGAVMSADGRDVSRAAMVLSNQAELSSGALWLASTFSRMAERAGEANDSPSRDAMKGLGAPAHAALLRDALARSDRREVARLLDATLDSFSESEREAVLALSSSDVAIPRARIDAAFDSRRELATGLVEGRESLGLPSTMSALGPAGSGLRLSHTVLAKSADAVAHLETLFHEGTMRSGEPVEPIAGFAVALGLGLLAESFGKSPFGPHAYGAESLCHAESPYFGLLSHAADDNDASYMRWASRRLDASQAHERSTLAAALLLLRARARTLEAANDEVAITTTRLVLADEDLSLLSQATDDDDEGRRSPLSALRLLPVLLGDSAATSTVSVGLDARASAYLHAASALTEASASRTAAVTFSDFNASMLAVAQELHEADREDALASAWQDFAAHARIFHSDPHTTQETRRGPLSQRVVGLERALLELGALRIQHGETDSPSHHFGLVAALTHLQSTPSSKPFALRDALARLLSRLSGQVATEAGELLEQAKNAQDVAARVKAYEALAELDGSVRGDAASALLWHKAILEQAPHHLPSLRYLEDAWLANGALEDLDAVESALGEALSGTGAGVAHAELAWALRKRQGAAARTDDLLALLQRNVALGKGSSTYAARLEFNDALRDANDGHIASSAALLAERATHDGDRNFLKRVQAAAELRRGATEEAKAVLRDIVDRDAADLPALWMQVAIALRQKERAFGATALEQAARATFSEEGRAQAWYGAAQQWERVDGEADRVAHALDQTLAADPNYKDAFTRLADLYAELGRDADLAALLEQRIAMVDDDDERTQFEVTRARALLRLGESDAARAVLSDTLARRPDHPVALAVYGDECAAQEQWEEAENAWVRLARILPDEADQRVLYMRLADLYAHRRPNPNRAEVAYKEVLKRAPDDEEALLGLIAIYRANGDLASTLQTHERYVTLAPDDAARRVRLIELARIHETLGAAPRRAEHVLDAARKEFPQSIDLLRALAEFYVRHKQLPAVNILLDRAAGDARRNLTAGRSFAQAFDVLALAAELRGKRDGAAVLADASRAASGSASEAARIVGAGPRALDPRLDDVLAPEGLSPAFRALLARTGDAFDAAAPFDLARIQAITPGPTLTSLSNQIRNLAEQIGMRGTVVHASAHLGRACLPCSSNPPTLIFGGGLASAQDELARAFLIVRAIKLVYARGSALLRIPSTEIPILVGAWIRAFNPTWVAPGLDVARVDEAARRMAPGFPAKVDPNLGVLALEAASTLVDFGSNLGALMSAWANRAALLSIGDVSAALTAIAWNAGLPELPNDADARTAFIARSDEARDLLAFVTSEPYLEARKRLGIDK